MRRFTRQTHLMIMICLAIKPSSDNRDDHLVFKLWLERRSKDNISIRTDRTGNYLGCLLNFCHTHIIATGHVKQHALCTVNRHLDQRTLDRLLSGLHRTVLAIGPTDSHQRRTSPTHHRLDISKVEINQTMLGNQL